MKKQIILGSFLAIASLGFGQQTQNLLPSQGWVGIGTTSPASKLHLQSSIARDAFRINLYTSTTNYLNIWQGGGGAAIDPIGTGVLYLGYDQATNVYIGANGLPGKLAVGTSNADKDITLKGEMGFYRTGSFPTTSSAGYIKYDNGGFTFGNSSGNDPLKFQTNSIDRLFIQNDGKIGIGTTSPLATLHVSSNALIGGATSSNISAGPNVQLGVYQNSPIGIGQCIELRSNTTNAINTLLICDRDDEYAIQVNKFMNPGYQTNFRVMANGKTIIGNQTQVAPHNDALLTVNGKIVSKSLYVRPGGWADFVFDENYLVPNLYDIEKYYKQNKHLPDVPSALDVEEKGIEVAEMNKLLLQKLEEMTILMVKMQKEIDALKQK